MNTSRIRVRSLLSAMNYFHATDHVVSYRQQDQDRRALGQVKIAANEGPFRVDGDLATISEILNRRDIDHERNIDDYGCGSLTIHDGRCAASMEFQFGALDSIETYE